MPITHRMANKNPAYESWKKMRIRCMSKRSPDYKDYGARGITICARWEWYPNFIKDMGPRPPNTVLDRKNNKLGYCKSNCRWATHEESARNRTHLKKYEINGKTKWLYEWVQIATVPPQTVYSRLNRGWSVRDAITQPKGMRP